MFHHMQGPVQQQTTDREIQMGRNDSDCSLLILILVASAGFMGYTFGLECGTKWTQDQAIQAKVGHWNVDPTTGKTDFVFTPVASGQ